MRAHPTTIAFVAGAPSGASAPTRWSLLGSVLALVVFSACASAPARAAAQQPGICAARVARLWHGRTPNDKAEAYAAYLSEALPAFGSIPGNLGYQLMRETVGAETHFTVISYWSSLEAIHGYAGADIRKTRALPRDPEFLITPEPTVMNYSLETVSADCSRPWQRSTSGSFLPRAPPATPRRTPSGTWLSRLQRVPRPPEVQASQ